MGSSARTDGLKCVKFRLESLKSIVNSRARGRLVVWRCARCGKGPSRAWRLLVGQVLGGQVHRSRSQGQVQRCAMMLLGDQVLTRDLVRAAMGVGAGSQLRDTVHAQAHQEMIAHGRRGRELIQRTQDGPRLRI